MTDLELNLTTAERECLVEVLERALKETRVEEHRTRAPEYREHVSQREDLITSLLGKLGQTVNAA
jgi:hypothetical protein